MIANLVVFIFGSIIGSFLNVCIYRMPLGESVVWPRSHCPKCQKRIPGYDNIPFISFILLGGKCRFCKEKISLRYPLVELLTAVMLVVLFNRYGLTYDFFFYMVLLWALIISTFVDIKHRIIPDEVSIGGMIVGFILSVIQGFNMSPLHFSFKPTINSLLGIFVDAAEPDKICVSQYLLPVNDPQWPYLKLAPLKYTDDKYAWSKQAHLATEYPARLNSDYSIEQLVVLTCSKGLNILT